MKHRLIPLLSLGFSLMAVSPRALSDRTDYASYDLVELAKFAVDAAVKDHADLVSRGLVVSGYQVGRVGRHGKVFDGTIVFYNYQDADGTPRKREQVVQGLDRSKLPARRLSWIVQQGVSGPFTRLELLSVAKLAVDQSRVDSGGDATHRIATFKVFRSSGDFPVVARVAWRHTDRATGEVKRGEFKYGCHKHEIDYKLECHRED